MFATNPGTMDELVEFMAITLYETDEDMTDEQIGTLALRQKWTEADHPRLSWSELDLETRQAYERRAKAALAALGQFLSGSIPIRKI